MEMVGHNHEAVKQIFLLLAVVKKDIDKQIGGERSREYGFALGGHRSDEKCAVHPCRVMQAEEEKCERDHAETGRLLGSRETGPKASYEKAERGPEGPLFHGARMDGWRIGVCNPSLRAEDRVRRELCCGPANRELGSLRQLHGHEVFVRV
jgi:hypothetical protein